MKPTIYRTKRGSKGRSMGFELDSVGGRAAPKTYPGAESFNHVVELL
jgi:hypothetical protein